MPQVEYQICLENQAFLSTLSSSQVSVDLIVFYKPAGYGIDRILLSAFGTDHFESLAYLMAISHSPAVEATALPDTCIENPASSIEHCFTKYHSSFLARSFASDTRLRLNIKRSCMVIL